MLPIYTQIFYARKWPVYLIFATTCIPFLILKLQGEQMKGLDIALLIAIAFNVLLYNLAKHISITIDDYGITHQVIWKKQSMAWKDIRSTKLAFEMHGKSGQTVWNFTSIDNKKINFSTGFFSRQAIQRIAEAVVQKCPGDIITEKIKAFSQGKFPWYVI